MCIYSIILGQNSQWSICVETRFFGQKLDSWLFGVLLVSEQINSQLSNCVDNIVELKQ